MNPTTNQITECEDEKQLCEWAAVYCMGWKPAELWLNGEKIGESFDGVFTPDKAGDYKLIQNELRHTEMWQPTSPTEKGKAQCWDLAGKYHCWPRLRNGKYVVFVNDKTEVEHENPQIAVVKAAIIQALNGEEL